MKIVVFGPDKRTGVLQEDQVVDISSAYAKYLGETDWKGQPGDVPSELGQFIEGGDRTLGCAQKTLDYLFGNAADHEGADGGAVVCAAVDTQLHAPIAPGMFQTITIASVSKVLFDQRIAVEGPCVLAFDGERERVIKPGQKVFMSVSRRGPSVLNIEKTMQLAAQRQLFTVPE